jgi:hypothetical protein
MTMELIDSALEDRVSVGIFNNYDHADVVQDSLALGPSRSNGLGGEKRI